MGTDDFERSRLDGLGLFLPGYFLPSLFGVRLRDEVALR